MYMYVCVHIYIYIYTHVHTYGRVPIFPLHKLDRCIGVCIGVCIGMLGEGVLAHARMIISTCSKHMFTLLDSCVSSLHRGHANLLCTVPNLTHDARRESSIDYYNYSTIQLFNYSTIQLFNYSTIHHHHHYQYNHWYVCLMTCEHDPRPYDHISGVYKGGFSKGGFSN